MRSNRTPDATGLQLAYRYGVDCFADVPPHESPASEEIAARGHHKFSTAYKFMVCFNLVVATAAFGASVTACVFAYGYYRAQCWHRDAAREHAAKGTR